jgi:FlgD Ig-like domain
MTKRLPALLFIGYATLCSSLAQESPTATPSPTPEQTASAPPTTARNVRLSFVPPPMEGTISLGIFDATGKLVRILHREAKIDSFEVDADSLNTTWDGKNDAGEDLPPGKYRARGYLVGNLKSEALGKAATPPPADSPDHVSVKLVTNPLVSDTRSVVDLGVGFDAKGSFLKTMDGLPLSSVSEAPNLARAFITKKTDKAAEVWQDDGSGFEQFRVPNIDKMMAFDCGFFELK